MENLGGTRVYRKVWFAGVFVLGAGCGLLALVSFALAGLIVAAFCYALVCSAVGYLMTEGSRGTGRVWAGCRRNAWIGACAGLAATGAVKAAGVAGLLLIGLAVASSPVVLGWVLTRTMFPAPSGRPAESWFLPGATTRLPRQWTRQDPSTAGADATWAATMTNDELILAWRRSFLHLSHVRSASELCHVVELRRGLLDEVQRRDPEGFANWMHSGARAAGDPTRYLRTRPGSQPDGNV